VKSYKKLIYAGLFSFFLFIFIYISFAYWEKLFSVLRIMLYASVISYVLVPAAEWLERYMPGTAAILLLFAALLVIIAVICILIVPPFINQVASLSAYIPELVSELKAFSRDIQSWLEKAGINFVVQQSFEKGMDILQKRLLKITPGIVERIMDGAAGIPGFFLIPVLSFYFLRDRKYFKKNIIRLIPFHHRKSIIRTFSEIHRILNRFIRSQLITALVIGIFTTIGFLAIKLPYALVLGIILGVFEIIPYFGPWLGAIPAVIIAIINAPTKIIWTIIVVIIVQQLEGSFITPKIMGDHVGLHPVYIIISLWLGGIFFGILGMLFAVPVVLVIRVIVKNIYINIASISP
jgi:predicted PurR-regulated permease PerM